MHAPVPPILRALLASAAALTLLFTLPGVSVGKGTVRGPDGSPAPPVLAAPGPSGAAATEDALAATTSAVAELIPMVPIVSFWSDERSITTEALRRLVDNPIDVGPGRRTVAVSNADLEPLAAVLGLSSTTAMAMPAEDVKRLVKAMPGSLGIVRADDVTPDVRALSVDGVELFGVDRTWRLTAWPLIVREPGVTSAFSAGRTWTLAAGGDVMLDKAVYAQSIIRKHGVDYAWDGGTAAIDRTYCCGWGHKPIVAGHRTGQEGAFGDTFRNADLAIVNLESPEPNRFRYHASGFVFTGSPALLAGLRNAGIDVAGLANNHLGNGGRQGILDTIANLNKVGVGHAGAGVNSTAARKPAWVQAGGLRVAVLAYCWIDPASYWASSSGPGSAGYSVRNIVRDIKAARAGGADYVIVMPHWGTEYTDRVAAQQRTDAKKMVAAGADLILGSHSHWVGPFEQISAGHYAFYSLGDLIFDWTHDQRTQEGVVVEMTFSGTRLVQLDLLPTLIIAGQPNFLDPAGDGKVVLGPVRRTSEPLLHW